MTWQAGLFRSRRSIHCPDKRGGCDSLKFLFREFRGISRNTAAPSSFPEIPRNPLGAGITGNSRIQQGQQAGALVSTSVHALVDQTDSSATPKPRTSRPGLTCPQVPLFWCDGVCGPRRGQRLEVLQAAFVAPASGLRHEAHPSRGRAQQPRPARAPQWPGAWPVAHCSDRRGDQHARRENGNDHPPLSQPASTGALSDGCKRRNEGAQPARSARRGFDLVQSPTQGKVRQAPIVPSA